MVRALLLLTLGVTVAAAAPEDPAARLIHLAGATDDEAARLAYLQELARLPGLDTGLRADAEKLAYGVDQWLHNPDLTFFNGKDPRASYLKYDLAETSSLYPLLCFCRARQVVWNTIESGGAWNSAKRRELLDQAVADLRRASAAFPENRLIRMYLGEPVPPQHDYPAVPGAPDWAVAQREGLERLADIIEWWIDHRQRDDGQYGGGWGDDCEMWRWWVPVLIAFDDPKLTAAQAKLSAGLLAQPHMAGGYTRHMYDVEHTAEDSADVLTPMMHLQPDNPDWSRRALRLAELMETLWTGRNARGQLQFKSTWFAVDRVDPDNGHACDTVYHPRAVQPALLYWQRTGDPKLGALFGAWMDTWVDASLRAERGKPAGVLPSAIHWPDGAVGGVGPEWWDPRNHSEETLYQWPSASPIMVSTMLLAYRMTGQERYLEPLRAMAKLRLEYVKQPVPDAPAGSAAWCGRRLKFISPIVAKYALLAGSHEFDAFLDQDATPYVAFRRHGDRAALTDALRGTAEALRLNFAGYTSEVRYTDRVLRWPTLFARDTMFAEAKPWARSADFGLLYSSATGDPSGDAGYFPMNAVRWLTRPRDLAALVTAADTTGLTAELYHFGETPRPMAAELYLLAPGTYRAAIVPAAGGEPRGGVQELAVTGARTRVAFTLPARTLCVLKVRPTPAVE